MTEVNPTEKNGAPALSFVLQANDPKERQANVEIVAEDGKVIGSGSARVGERTELALPQATVVARRPGMKRASLRRPESRSGWRCRAIRCRSGFLTAAMRCPLRSKSGRQPEPMRWRPGLSAATRSRERWTVLPGSSIWPAMKSTSISTVRSKTGNFCPPGTMLRSGTGIPFRSAISVPQADMFRANNDGIQETAYAEFGVSADNRSWVWASMNLNRMGLAAPVPGMISHSKITDGVLLYRVAIPWRR